VRCRGVAPQRRNHHPFVKVSHGSPAKRRHTRDTGSGACIIRIAFARLAQSTATTMRIDDTPRLTFRFGPLCSSYSLPGLEGMASIRSTRDDRLVKAVVYPTLEAAGLPRPETVERVHEGVGNHVYFAGQDLVVRVGTGYDGSNFPAAVAVLRAVAGLARVPGVLYADTTRVALPYPVMVLERLAGMPLSRTWPHLAPDERVAALERLMRELDILHGLSATVAPEAAFSDPWWGPRVAFIERELGRHGKAGSFPSHRVARMERHLHEHRDALTKAPRVGLLHGDPGLSNALFAGRELSGLIDFDATRYGPAEEDTWQLLFEAGLEPAPWMPLARLRELPHFDLYGPGVHERYLIRETENILLLLSGELSWKTPEAAREDAFETYRDAFENDRIARLLEELA